MKKRMLSSVLAVVITALAVFIPSSVFALASEDKLPPTVDVDSLSLSHNYLITGDLMNISIGITDFSDIEEAYIFYEMPVSKGVVYMPLLRHKDTGKFTIEFYIDNYTECGEWKALYIAAADSAGNKTIIGNDENANIKADLSSGNFNVINVFAEGVEPHDYRITMEQTLPLVVQTDVELEWSVSDKSIAKLTVSTTDTVVYCTVVPLKTGVVDVTAKDKQGNVYASVRVLITKPVDSYWLYFDPQGGSVEVEKIEAPIDYSVQLPSAQKKGYVFLGWSRNPKAIKPEYKANEVYIPMGDVNLYAVWKKEITYPDVTDYNVRLNINDGISETQINKIKKGESLTLTTPEREGYTCIGWSTQKYDVIPEYRCGQKYTPNKDVELYAVWVYNYPEAECDYVKEEHEKITIQINVPYKAQGIPADTTALSLSWSCKFDENKQVTQGQCSVTAKKPGISEVYICDEYGYIIDVYRICIKKSTLTCKLNLDTYGGEEIEPIVVNYGETIVLPTPVREGYRCKGWTIHKNAALPQHRCETEYKVTDDVTLYAIWDFASPPKEGDVNLDGVVNSTDALIVLKVSVGKTTLRQELNQVADVNDNIIINSTDALLILQYAVGKRTEF